MFLHRIGGMASFCRFLCCLPQTVDAGAPCVLRRRVTEQGHLFHTNRGSDRNLNPGPLNQQFL
jgi:hypothetical protein